ncbi:MAG TPA: hypothetical protein IAA29_16555 [Candidatus Paenibacillus intestinavium]|nr:hypothetical protein [Candidatus Paenibacillus intestinavium]
MAKQDMDWVVRPLSWDAGAFIGNGTIGAMVYGEEHASQRNILRFVMGRTDIIAHTEGRTNFDPRVPIGEFHLVLEGWMYNPISLRLDIWNAELSAHITTTTGEVKLRALILSDSPLMVVELFTSTGEAGAKLEWIPYSELDSVLQNSDGINMNQYIPQIEVGRYEQDGMMIGTQSYSQKALDGCTTAWKTTRSDHNHVINLVSIVKGTDEYAKNRAVTEIVSATNQSLESLVDDHRQWWHRYYEQSFVSIPDAKLESFYWIQMYKLASAARENTPIIDNIGPWLTSTPWAGAWFNMNVQLSYSPVYTANRLNIGQSLIHALQANWNQLIANVPKPFQHNSSGLGRSSSLDMKSELDDETGNLTWVCHCIWRHYRHAMNDDLLRDLLYPLLRRSINYYLHIIEEKDGYWHLPPTISPEYGSFKKLKVQDCHYDLALLRWGCQTLISVCQRLGLDDPLEEKWRDVMKRLTSFPIDETGLLIGAKTPIAFGHRHFSHLFAIYPLHLLDIDKMAERELMKRSLKTWLSLEGDLRGFSFTGAASIAATLEQGDMALNCLQTLLQMITPNTMYKEAGPVIETPLAGAEAIHDMLLQSWGDTIRIFPAVPEEWEDAAFHDLRAEGAFLVSAVRKCGQTAFVRVKSLAGEPCKIKVNDWIEHHKTVNVLDSQKNPWKGIWSQEQTGSLELELQTGEEIVITAGDVDLSALTISPVKPNKPVRNFFGGHTPWREFSLP